MNIGRGWMDPTMYLLNNFRVLDAGLAIELLLLVSAASLESWMHFVCIIPLTKRGLPIRRR